MKYSLNFLKKAALEEKERHQTLNNQLHHKLADYFRKRKSDDIPSQSLFDKSSQDQEQRYIKYLSKSLFVIIVSCLQEAQSIVIFFF